MKKFLLLLVLLMILLVGCGGGKVTDEKETSLDYTIVPRADIPETLMNTLNDKKQESMTMTYGEGEYLYIIVGYGKKPTGGYSISVEKLTQSSSEIHIRTNLRGPAAGEAVNKADSYPYIVLKTEYTDKKVVFE